MKPLRDSRVCADNNRHTCIELSRTNGVVNYIPLTHDGFEVKKMSEALFDDEFTPLTDYPVNKAAKLYVEYAQHLGATPEAMRELAIFTPITPKEIEMATAKQKTDETKPTTKKAVAPAAKKTSAKPVAAKKAAPAKKTPAPKKVAPSDEASSRKPSAASRFKELILSGEFTDEQIFKKVQKEFGLDDNKKTYVKWYRNSLIKDGQKVPEAR